MPSNAQYERSTCLPSNEQNPKAALRASNNRPNDEVEER